VSTSDWMARYQARKRGVQRHRSRSTRLLRRTHHRHLPPPGYQPGYPPPVAPPPHRVYGSRSPVHRCMRRSATTR
jgi:hypothetical protein